MAEEILEKIKDRESDFSSLRSRMDTDKDLRFGKAYEMKDTKNRKIHDVINVTLNDAMTYGQRVSAAIQHATMQPEVEGEGLKDKDIRPIEGMFKALFIDGEADKILVRRKLQGLDGFLGDQMCFRGRGAMRVWFHEEEGVFIPDIMPVDTRYLVHDEDHLGTAWVAYRVKRSKAQIEQDYGEEIVKELKSKVAEVTEYCDRERRILYIANKKVQEDPNIFKDLDGKPYCPWAISLTGSTSFMDEDAFEHRGESIYWPVRLIYPELNRIASISQTATDRVVNGSYQLTRKLVDAINKPASPFRDREVIQLLEGEGYELIPINDIKAATRLIYAILDNRKQQGSLTSIDYGNLTFPLPAAGIKLLTAAKDLIFVPILQGLAMLYQQAFEMACWQYIQIGKRGKLGRSGSRMEINPADLKKEYWLGLKFYAQDPVDDIANATIADALSPHVSGDFIRRNVLKLEDPDGEKDKKDAEDTERLFPKVKAYRSLISTVRQAEEGDEQKNVEAWLMWGDFQNMLTGTQQPVEEETRERPSGQLAAMPSPTGGGGKRGKPLEPTAEEFAEQEAA